MADTIILTYQQLGGDRVTELSQQSLVPEVWLYKRGDNLIRPSFPLSDLLAGVLGWQRKWVFTDLKPICKEVTFRKSFRWIARYILRVRTGIGRWAMHQG